jgi:hypothetical protein
MSDAAEPTVHDLARRLTEAVQRVEAAEASLAETRVTLASVERALAAARAAEAVPSAPAPAASEPPAAPAPPPAAPAAEAPAAEDAAGTDAAAASEPPPPADPRPPELVARLDAQQRALQKRGFHRDDLYFHKCPRCGEQAVAKYTLTGKPGGRDIDLCLACGVSASWRRRPDREDRERDETFDLATFLR